MPNDLTKLRHSLQKQLDELAHQAMLSPQRDQFDHGMQVGRYAAVNEVILTIEHLLKEDTDE